MNNNSEYYQWQCGLQILNVIVEFLCSQKFQDTIAEFATGLNKETIFSISKGVLSSPKLSWSLYRSIVLKRIDFEKKFSKNFNC